jgi:hypothetical protein
MFTTFIFSYFIFGAFFLYVLCFSTYSFKKAIFIHNFHFYPFFQIPGEPLYASVNKRSNGRGSIGGDSWV